MPHASALSLLDPSALMSEASAHKLRKAQQVQQAQQAQQAQHRHLHTR